MSEASGKKKGAAKISSKTPTLTSLFSAVTTNVLPNSDGANLTGCISLIPLEIKVSWVSWVSWGNGTPTWLVGHPHCQKEEGWSDRKQKGTE